jgi:hypothetical protein
MRLSRLFRKYSRVLMLVVMSLLLVVFLIGDVISRAARTRSGVEAEIGRAFGKEITSLDLQRTHGKLDLLGKLGFADRAVDPVQRLAWNLVAASAHERERVLAWYLLMEEARQMGVHVGREEVVALLGSQGIGGNYLARVRDDSNRSLDSIYRLAGAWLSIFKVEQIHAGALGGSLPRAEIAYRDEAQEALVKLAVIESTAFLPSVAEPTEEEIQAYFEEAKARETAHEEDRLVFGYRQPDRVQVEYLTVDPGRIQNKVSVRGREARRYYEQNKQKYVERVPRPTASSTQPVWQQYDEVQRTYEEVEEQVREDCRAEKAIQEAQRLVNRMRDEARRPWEAAPRGEDHFRVAPADDALVSFEELRDKHSDLYEVSYGRTELLDIAGLQGAPGLGRASFQLGADPRNRVSAAALAFRVKGLVEADPEDAVSALNLFEPSRLLFESRRDRETRQQLPYQAYFFRVIRVKPSGPPDSIDLVREKLVQDLRLLKAHELAGERAQQLATSARAAGLETAVESAEDLKKLLAAAEEWASTQPEEVRGTSFGYTRYLVPFTPIGSFTRTPRHVGYVGLVPTLHKQVFALADSQPSTGPVHRVALVQVTEDQKWVVAELEEIKPIYAGDFEKRQVDLARATEYQERLHLMQAWYDTENILRRTGFVWAQSPEE